METDELKDDEDELAALMTASTTVRKRKIEIGPTINPKRRKQLKDLAALTSTDDACQSERDQNFATNYFNQLKIQLDAAPFEKVSKLLSEFDGSSEGVINLFKEVSGLLPATLAKEFLCFLTPDQAHLCGKFMDHLILSKITDFFRKFEISFAKQPQMVRKFYDILCQLASSENVSIQQVRDAVLPLLKSKSFLMEYFLQLFPDEKPSDSFVLDDYEDIYLDGDCSSEEEIRLVETEDAANCPCSCHPSQSTHCKRCAVKYINGRVYIQAGKILRTARVEFSGLNPLEALRRVCVNSEELTPKAKPSRRKPEVHSSQKDLSPLKHVSSPHMAATESEDESLEVKASSAPNKPKSARSLKIKFKSSDKLSAKTKNPKAQEAQDEMRLITDENAITDVPDCFLARRLSPDEATDGKNLNFNNILSDDQNDPSTLNFTVHSPLKRASICLDSLDSTSESMQSPIKIDQRLCIPLKRIDEEELMLSTRNTPSDSFNISSETIHSSLDRSDSENSKPGKSDISGTIESIFTSSDVDEMNLFLGSSGMDKINSFGQNPTESVKNTQNNTGKYGEPTLDSLGIDSFLNISNLDAKIDSFLTNTEGTKNLDALLNDSSPESSNFGKNISAPESSCGKNISAEEPDLPQLKGDQRANSGEVCSGGATEKLAEPVSAEVHSIDSILDLMEQSGPKTQVLPSSRLANDIDKKLEGVDTKQPNNELPQGRNVDLLSPSRKIGSIKIEIKEEVQDMNQSFEVSSPVKSCNPVIEPVVVHNMDSILDLMEEKSSEIGSPASILESETGKKSTSENFHVTKSNKPPLDSYDDRKFQLSPVSLTETLMTVTKDGEDLGEKHEAIEKVRPVVVHNMDSILDLMEQKSPKLESETNGRNFQENLEDTNKTPSASSEHQNFQLSPKKGNTSVKVEVQEEVVSFKSENITYSLVPDYSDLKSEEVGERVSVSEVDYSGSSDPTFAPGASSILMSQKDEVQSVSFMCGADGDENGKVTLFSVDITEGKIVLHDNVVSVPLVLTQQDVCDEQILGKKSRVLEKISSLDSSSSSSGQGRKQDEVSVPEKLAETEVSMTSNSCDNVEKMAHHKSESCHTVIPSTVKKVQSEVSDSQILTDSSDCTNTLVISRNYKIKSSKNSDESTPDPSRNVIESEKQFFDESCSSEDTPKGASFRFSDSSCTSSIKDTIKTKEASVSDPASLPRNKQADEISESSGGLMESKKDEGNVGDSSSDSPMSPLETRKKEEFVRSDSSSTPSKDSENSEKLASSEHKNKVAVDKPTQNDSPDGSKLKDESNDWTMEEDKIILQTFQKDPDMQDIFSKIKTLLPERSLEEVQGRFYVLIELLEKMSHSSDDAGKKE